ncbi:MAG: proton-conducting transporter transmembrane domain-containing protein [Candidatus Loosdrechtia sp.]|uniref:proton-conducting transporter transmembrane domain-containing protein n=1 Tax=Candidatus Loosdrechtia sp. TaxID=3101272 RepID=UPI003A601034|nr:MAG: proton-conducting transporter membrane subunit [Candidatus Jettenia sp. AMX2]
MIAYYPLLIPFLPLVVAMMTFLLEGLLGEKVYRIGVLMKMVVLGISLMVFREVIIPGNEAIHLAVFSSSWSGLLQFYFLIDRLAAVMIVLMSGISVLISMYSLHYMQPERGRARFHILIDITTFALVCIVLSANLLMLFIFWQLLSWLLGLLAYNYSHLPTVKGSFKTFTILRAGDVFFFGGIVLAYGLYGTLDFHQIFSQAGEVSASFSLWPGGGEISAVTVVTLLIFIGAMSKSVQFPFHAWLPEFMYAPTPVTAFLHAGIINAGGFLLNRLAPLYAYCPVTLHVIFVTGFLTALLGASMMLTQNDMKKTLGYSTIAQMGYMIMECGLGAFSLAIFHLIAHGLFKATAFLNSGHVIHDARQEPRFPYRNEKMERVDFSLGAWLTGFITTLILPLIILYAAHGALKIPVRDLQGIVVFLFFSWVTSSQAIVTLYRLQITSWKVMIIMLIALLMIVFTYLLAGEKFTYFLHPSVDEVHQYYQAAALPGRLFDLLVITTALFIILGWIFIYAKTHGLAIRMPKWLHVLQIRLYLFFMNRLYLENLVFLFGRKLLSLIHRLDKDVLFRYLPAGAAISLVFLAAVTLIGSFSVIHFILFFVIVLMLPLFPFHGVYVTALTRLPGYYPPFISFLLPATGLYGIINLLPAMPVLMLKVVSILALSGVLYGSLKALVQHRVNHILAYMGVAYYSVLWWYLANTATYAPQEVVYLSAVVLVTTGLFLAWRCIQVRYGDLSLERIGGLARPMPRFAVLWSLLVMAAMGLPPFGLFSGYAEMLLRPPTAMSWALVIILFAWFAASWYLLRMMHHLLFGPHREDISYKDLRHREVFSLLLIILTLAFLGILPYGFLKERSVMVRKEGTLPLFRIGQCTDEDVKPPLFPVREVW